MKETLLAHGSSASALPDKLFPPGPKTAHADSGALEDV